MNFIGKIQIFENFILSIYFESLSYSRTLWIVELITILFNLIKLINLIKYVEFNSLL